MKGKDVSEKDSEKLIEFLEVLEKRMIEWQGHVQQIIEAVKGAGNGQ